MDKRLQAALDFANYKQSFVIKQKTLKEKIDAKLTYGFNGGLFKIDRLLLTFVHILQEMGRDNNVVILDANETPILIEDLDKFKTEIYDRYFTSINEYFEEHQNLKKSRSVERLLDV